jgi:hypothetical protein
MWKLIPKFVRRWFFVVIVVPLLAWGLELAADALERRRGPSRATHLMRQPRRFLQHRAAA